MAKVSGEGANRSSLGASECALLSNEDFNIDPVPHMDFGDEEPVPLQEGRPLGQGANGESQLTIRAIT